MKNSISILIFLALSFGAYSKSFAATETFPNPQYNGGYILILSYPNVVCRQQTGDSDSQFVTDEYYDGPLPDTSIWYGTKKYGVDKWEFEAYIDDGNQEQYPVYGSITCTI